MTIARAALIVAVITVFVAVGQAAIGTWAIVETRRAVIDGVRASDCRDLASKYAAIGYRASYAISGQSYALNPEAYEVIPLQSTDEASELLKELENVNLAVQLWIIKYGKNREIEILNGHLLDLRWALNFLVLETAERRDKWASETRRKIDDALGVVVPNATTAFFRACVG